MEVPGSSSHLTTLHELILINVAPAKFVAIVARRSLR